jgi:quinoprotein glucose dehydrogenase
MLTQRTLEAHAWALEQFKSFRSGGLFVPFAIDKQTIILPGFDGGAEWGGSAVDPRSGVIYINSNDVAWTGGLTLNRQGRSPGETTYLSQCSACHGTDRGGSPPAFPSLVDIPKTLSDVEITSVVHQGKGRMPSSPNIDDASLRELLIFFAYEARHRRRKQAAERRSVLQKRRGLNVRRSRRDSNISFHWLS